LRAIEPDELSNSKATVTALLCADENYAHYASIALQTAAFASGDGPFQALVWRLGWSQRAIRAFARAIEGAPGQVAYVTHDALELAAIPTAPFVSLAANGRFLLPTCLPGHVERAIYLDADVVVRQSLRELIAIDLKGRSIAAVRDTQYPTVSASHASAALRASGLSEADPYFNSGLLVIDVDRWRQRDVLNAASQWIGEHERNVSHHDQDALNAIFADDWLELGLRWNRQAFDLPDGWTGRNDAVIHFTGAMPDNPRCRHPLRQHYLRLMSHSGYLERSELLQWSAGRRLRRSLYWVRMTGKALGLGNLARRVRNGQRRRQAAP
jgi:lipopolysaccharide biosynthesis glycosyltransferase